MRNTNENRCRVAENWKRELREGQCYARRVESFAQLFCAKLCACI